MFHCWNGISYIVSHVMALFPFLPLLAMVQKFNSCSVGPNNHVLVIIFYPMLNEPFYAFSSLVAFLVQSVRENLVDSMFFELSRRSTSQDFWDLSENS